MDDDYKEDSDHENIKDKSKRFEVLPFFIFEKELEEEKQLAEEKFEKEIGEEKFTQDTLAKNIEINSQNTRTDVPFLHSIDNLCTYFKEIQPANFPYLFDYNVIDILVNIGLTSEKVSIRNVSLLALYYIIQYIDNGFEYFVENEMIDALEAFLTLYPNRSIFLAILIWTALLDHEHELIERFIQTVTLKRTQQIIIKEEETAEGFPKLICAKNRPKITSLLAFIYAKLMKFNDISRDVIEIAAAVFSVGFSPSIKNDSDIPPLCAKGIYFMYKYKKFDRSLFSDPLPNFILFASSWSNPIDVSYLIRATYPFFEITPYDYLYDFHEIMTLAVDHKNDYIGKYAIRALVICIENETEDNCIQHFYSEYGIDFLCQFIEDSAFSVLQEAMRLLYLILKRTTDPQEFDLILSPKVFTLLARASDVKTQEMRHMCLHFFYLMSLRCTEEEIPSYLKFAENIGLFEIISTLLEELDDDCDGGEEETEKHRHYGEMVLEKIISNEE